MILSDVFQTLSVGIAVFRYIHNLNGMGRDQANLRYLPGLPDPVGPVGSLILYGQIPPPR